ncbi:MAG: sodium/proton-translocating pyrophosphatase, partial [Actinomycetota bacterium]
MRGVLAADQGAPKMREIADAIREGAEAFLRRQFRTIAIIVVPLAVLIFFTGTKVVNTEANQIVMTAHQNGMWRVVCFLLGAAFSGLTGFIGMSIAVRGNVRTAAAAANGGTMAKALQVAFRSGAVTGMLCVGLGLVGAAGIFLIFQNSATTVLVGFAFGASLLALFMRVGGGIFTKAADVGADLVGKVEAGIPEDDPRNAATIADNVGDNVGDCAGMAADLFESYEITIIAALILGYAAFHHQAHATAAVLYPLIVPAIGVIASIIGVYAVRARDKDKSAMASINRGFWLSSALTVAGA